MWAEKKAAMQREGRAPFLPSGGRRSSRRRWTPPCGAALPFCARSHPQGEVHPKLMPFLKKRRLLEGRGEVD